MSVNHDAGDIRKQGVWRRVFEVLRTRAPDALHLIDSSIVRAHQHAAALLAGLAPARATPLPTGATTPGRLSR